ncbi:MAG: tRNA (adenosine(37)-N6)-dimethylallyltransferase MiaA [Anaerolineales bacterium]
MPSNDPIIPLIAIVGPTAVGKTNLAVTVGPQFDAEIVSADSRQFYRYMEIGTAKPTPEERARIPHHLVDIADPDETVGLAQFLHMARAAIHDITARGKRSFLVGGTGQYVRALLRGWQVPEIPPDPALRERLEQEEEATPGTLWDRLMELDPNAADFIHPNNSRRIIRALEVTMKGDQTFSELRRREPPPYRILKIGLTMERAELYARADARVEAMMAAGLRQEVQRLLAQGYGWDLPAMSGLGYVQFRPYFAGEATLDEVVERIKLDTHDFIRRQYTWFSPADQDIHWLDATQHPADHAIPLIQAFLMGQQRA